ncbi:hypothetical protein I4U23_002022 [Adineta vaga]|nr:hypothetical protein I4U23_002022 [Adineta vaga]
MNDYERRFKRSLQKLTVPLWYTDAIPSSTIPNSSSKQSIISTPSIPWKTYYRQTQRTPEIIHLQHPYNYRSCRSSLATSPSPSIHSWHPNHMIEGMTFSLLKPSTSRRHQKYEKGIDRVSKSSRWYQPTQFIDNQTTNSQTGTIKTSTSIRHNQQSTTNNHYDAPKFYYNNDDDESLIFKSNCLVTNGSPENILVNRPTNNVIANDKQQDNHLNSNESQIMPMAEIQEAFSHLESKDLNDKAEDKRSLFIDKTRPKTDLSLSNDQINYNVLLERTANNLVQAVLSDIYLLENHDDDDDDDEKNRGVRELSDDENGLRELDENDMNDTDEFIVFATNADISDEDQLSHTPRCSLNRLYTFSRPHNYNHGSSNNMDSSKQTTSEQNSPGSREDQDEEQTISLQSNTTNDQSYEKFFHSTPMYHHLIEKQDITLPTFIDRIICPSNRYSSTHQSDEGVNEETARIGRFLLNSIPIPLIEDIRELSPTLTSNELILSDTEYIITDQDNNYDSTYEDSQRHEQRIIQEQHEELQNNVRRDSAYSSNQERIDVQQSYYEPLFECHSGYSFLQSDFLTPNISSVQSTTDEAYESEPTTMSSSIATTTHVHPDLEHEFEYPAPPPPVPDRRLKPAHLKSTTIPTKARMIKKDNIDSAGYSVIQKPKPSPLIAIQQLITSTANNSTVSSAKTMSSRHYCGSIPIANEVTQSSLNSFTPVKTNEQSKEKKKEKRTSKTLNCLHPSTADEHNNKRNLLAKLPLPSSSNKTKIKKQKLITNIDEATNGLAIRLPAPVSNGHDSIDKQNLNRLI